MGIERAQGELKRSLVRQNRLAACEGSQALMTISADSVLEDNDYDGLPPQASFSPAPPPELPPSPTP